MKIGFAGLGGMGRAMAHNLLQAGYPLTVWNRSPQAAQPLVDAGAQLAAQPADLAGVDILFTMLANDAALEQVVVTSGLLAQMQPGAAHVNMATISVALAQRLAALHQQHGVGYLAAPVLGRPTSPPPAGSIFWPPATRRCWRGCSRCSTCWAAHLVVRRAAGAGQYR
ncbi:2-hydroxy-3-oxopropionate reductase [Serratia rubidaea]|uniref:2-hydroxy-3-oxopropionate reductase n=1 Tax=Serratia rubidaea TaxID=61652 RepID=A0A3S4FU23_SERRU|nr:2-hydroxy-3-oxopropionate reductase [Serratia rubidaea]